MNPNGKSGVTDPPLETSERIEVDPETKEKIFVTINRRGILGTESRKYSSFDAWQKNYHPVLAKDRMERVCEGLRNELNAWGLPSDPQASWIRIGDGEWQPYAGDSKLLAKETRFCVETWRVRLHESTEPLSEQRCVVDALYWLTELLSQPGIEPFLENIAACVHSFSTLRIAGATNAFAAAGMAAQKGRAVGPAAKQKQAAQRRQVVWAIANEYWSTSQIHRGDAANTAAAIRDQVNEELHAKALLPGGKKGLSVKTISDHIRVCIGENYSDLASVGPPLASSEPQAAS